LPEIRVDPLSGHKTIVAGERSRRPGGEPRCVPPDPIDVAGDPFAEGHEDRTPPELYAVRPQGGPPDSPGWRVRVVPNLFPALTPAPVQCDPATSKPLTPASAQRNPADGGTPSIPTHSTPDRSSSTPAREGRPGDARRTPGPHAEARPDLFTAVPALGAHEVIVNAPQSVYSLAELPVEQVAAAVEVWRGRMRVHAGCAYSQLIVNERREAGASLPHTHAQLYALDFVPADVARERERAGAYATRTMGGDLLGDLLAEEVRRGERVVAIDDEAVLLAPYGSRVPFQLQLVPRRPRARFEEEGPTGAALLHDGLRRLARHLGSSPPLNLWVRTAPRGAERFCWRIDVLPRLTHLAGLELSTGLNLLIVAPEDAAAALREA
jgi:UDPglucose--hexose-1-phosphate uridylyltransferase